MRRSSRLVTWSVCLLLCLLQGLTPAIAQTAIPGATRLIVYNASNADSTVLLAAQGAGALGDGCTKFAQDFLLIDLATRKPIVITTFQSQEQGWFILKRGVKAEVFNKRKNPYTGQQSPCLLGFNISFDAVKTCPTGTTGSNNTVPITTPGPTFNQPKSPLPNLPNGGNIFEASLNLPSTVNGVLDTGAQNEAVDISCVNGANSTLMMTLTPPTGGPYWGIDTGSFGGGIRQYKSTFSTRNSWVDIANQCDANCIDPATGTARPGIFPYGCTQCNVFPDPAPPCSGQQFCAAKNGLVGNTGCQFQRAPIKVGNSLPPIVKFGGTVQCTFYGKLTPPGTCPPGTQQ